jgi:MoxR-like ATPase
MTPTILSAGSLIVNMVARALLGQRRAIELATCCFFASGHLLIEDVPGVGKTTLARALAKALGGLFRRIQFTSDLLPADITGVSVWDAKASAFRFKKGPIFGNIVLADEINRATPKTQSALLEAMSEKSVSVDGSPADLPDPFMVVATQNEQERHGTYPLPESQLDRFLMRISMGYPEPEAERKVVARRSLNDPVDGVRQIIDEAMHADIIAGVDGVHMDPAIFDYLVEIISRTRSSDQLVLGVGPRGGMALHRASRALALVRGRDFCLVDDLKEVAVPVLAHRIIPNGGTFGLGARDTAVRVLHEILSEMEIPL